MTETSSASLRASTIAIASAGVIVSGLLGYAIYFDHKRQSDPDFRKSLRKDSKREARAAREEADAQSARFDQQLQDIVDKATAQAPTINLEEREPYFMQEVGRGEALLQEGSKELEAAEAFYNALKVYPSPGDLTGIYDKTVTKPVLDIVAKLITKDPDLRGRLGGNAFDDT